MGEKVKDKDAEAAQTPPQENELDEGLENTFPASDPVSVTRDPPEKKGEPNRR